MKSFQVFLRLTPRAPSRRMPTMKLDNLPIDQAVGAILVHNIVGADGRKVLSKGRALTSDDLEKLRVLGKSSVYVARLDADDVREDDAAARLAQIVAGDCIESSKPNGGRVNFSSTNRGILKVDVNRLKRLNECQGITLATKPNYSLAAPQKMIATLKTIGLAVSASILRRAEEIGKVFEVVVPQIQRVAILLTGSELGKQRTQETFLPPIRARVEELSGQVVAETFVAENTNAIQEMIYSMLDAGAQMIIIAGETSVMDADDITPRGIKQAGGNIELYGAPVEPGNLLLLAYRGDVPIIGAPGCVKSRETNVIDLILPRLFVGEKVARADVIELAEGGLLI